MTKKELLNKIEQINNRLDNSVMNVDVATHRKIQDDFKLLLDYLGLELIIEKSVGVKSVPRYDLNGLCFGFRDEDCIKYTDKIVKNSKVKKSKNKK